MDDGVKEGGESAAPSSNPLYYFRCSVAFPSITEVLVAPC